MANKYYKLSFTPGDADIEVTEAVLREIQASPMVSIDTETSGLDFDSRMLGLSVGWRDEHQNMKSIYMNMGHPPSLFTPNVGRDICQAVVDSVFNYNRPIAMLSAVFDLEKFARWGFIDLPRDIDTLIDAQLLARWILSFNIQEGVSMEKLVNRQLGGVEPWVKGMKAMRSKLADMPAEKVGPYGRADAEYTLMLVEDLLAKCEHEYEPEILKSLISRESRFLWLLTRMQVKGVLLNVDEIQQRAAKLHVRMAGLRKEMGKFGITNPGSRNQLIAALPESVLKSLDMTEHNNYRLDSGSLQGKGPVTDAVLEFRSLEKAVSTWLEGFMGIIASDGRIHPRYRAAGTVSGRLSCSSPNLQAVPLEDRGAAFGDMSGIFMAPPDYSILAGDLAQAELRVVAAYAKSNQMARSFAAGKDIHRATAEATWPDLIIDDARRQLGKRCNFCTTYGGGYRALAQTADIPEHEAKVILDQYRRAFPELVQAQRLAGEVWLNRGYITLWTGRRHYKDPTDGEHKALNQVAQGNVAEMMKDAMLTVDEYVQSTGTGDVLLQIYDSIEVEVQTDKIEDVKVIMANAMAAAAPDKIMYRTDPHIIMETDFKIWFPKYGEAL